MYRVTEERSTPIHLFHSWQICFLTVFSFYIQAIRIRLARAEVLCLKGLGYHINDAYENLIGIMVKQVFISYIYIHSEDLQTLTDVRIFVLGGLVQVACCAFHY